MRLLHFVLILGVVGPTAVAQTAPQHGIQLGDLDRKADPCIDFFQYANGHWRAQNPIPASMDRWSRRWQSGELNKEQLKTILDEVSNSKQWPKGSVEQLISDHYGACMNESHVNALGLKPIEPMLLQIDAIKSTQDLQRMLTRLHEIGIFVPFGIYGAPVSGKR